MKKRSISIHGHPTSVALEPEFWAEVDRIARRRAKSVSSIIRELDDQRLHTVPDQGLASYIRVWTLNQLRQTSDQV